MSIRPFILIVGAVMLLTMLPILGLALGRGNLGPIQTTIYVAATIAICFILVMVLRRQRA